MEANGDLLRRPRCAGDPWNLRRLKSVFGGYGNFGDVVTKADEHRERAAACLRLAQEASDDKSRSLYLMMAEAWHALAEKAEATERADGK
jgi:hypothetical protein